MKQKVKIENSHPSGRQRISKILYSLWAINMYVLFKYFIFNKCYAIL